MMLRRDYDKIATFPATSDSMNNTARESARIGVEEEFGFIPRFTSGQMNTTWACLTVVLQTLKSFSLDFPALNVFFRVGMFLNGRTAFREIRRVNPEPIFVPATTLSRDAVIDAYIDLFRQSIRRRTPPHSALALSGGCDSRHFFWRCILNGICPITPLPSLYTEDRRKWKSRRNWPAGQV